ncbi:MAG: hypothetical protein CYPHOPRED_006010, partial [Cyphobasidiales sp. Tagirdzhanova-0007]
MSTPLPTAYSALRKSNKGNQSWFNRSFPLSYPPTAHIADVRSSRPPPVYGRIKQANTPARDIRPDLLIKWKAWTAGRANANVLVPLPELQHRNEETHFARPLTERVAAKEALVSASGTLQHPEASTSSLDPLYDFVTHGLLPQSQSRIRQLILSAQDSCQPKIVKEILAALRKLPSTDLEEIARHALLVYPVVRPYHAFRDRSARLSKSRNRQTAAVHIPQDMFLENWNRLWTVRGESLRLQPEVASHLLEVILDLPAQDGLDYGKESEVSALRHLLFLAGLDQHPVLALDLLTHIIEPHAITALPYLEELPRYSQKETASDDIPLVLHDLLRAGIVTSTVIKEFDVTSAIGKASILPKDQYNVLLSQLLLRMITRTYAIMRRFDRALLLLRYLQPLPGAFARPEQESRDVVLIKDVCIAALQQSS